MRPGYNYGSNFYEQPDPWEKDARNAQWDHNNGATSNRSIQKSISQFNGFFSILQICFQFVTNFIGTNKSLQV